MIKLTGTNNVPNFEDYKSVSSSQYTIRDKEYTKILTNYKENQQRLHWTRLIMKILFFILISLSFIAIIMSSCAIVTHIVQSDLPKTINDTATIITAVAGMISAIIILPTIVAKHLFPENEEDSQITVIKTMQKFDTDKNNSSDTTDDNTITIHQPIIRNNKKE